MADAIWDKGYTQVYTGDGKGKTTAALGLTVRALGAGLQVYWGQFMKCRECSEHRALTRFADLITLEKFGSGQWVCRRQDPDPSEVERARQGLGSVQSTLQTGLYKLVVADEILGALGANLLDLEGVLALIRNKPPEVELILTGRAAPLEVIEAADLVTEMTEVKHYFKAGVPSRVGIEE